MTRPAVINSLSRGAQILRLLVDSANALGATDVAERLGVDPSTAYRLLATLETHGFVSQDPGTKKYSIGYGILEVASGLLRRLSVVEIAQPHLRALSARTGENSHVAVRDRLSAVSVGSESATGILRVETTIGSGEPLHCTAVGKALLVDYTHALLLELYGADTLQRYTPQTITTLDELEAELARVRRLGYAFDDEELHPGVRCIAAPVRDRSGRVVAAFGVSSPAVRLTRDRIPDLAARICESAEAISVQLGYAQRAAALS
jgi:IclR family acetate operon transcriptional repressor